MKKALPVILCLTILFFYSCKKDDDNLSPLQQLPPATQTGANTGGALVNGEAFLPNFSLNNSLVCYFLDGKDFAFGISGGTRDRDETILISLRNIQLNLNKIYSLNTIFNDEAKSGEYTINSTPPPSPLYFSTNSIITGELVFTHHDFDKAILSGTFWFDAINSEGEIIEVRAGRFDMEY